jgi:hypothetical protein
MWLRDGITFAVSCPLRGAVLKRITHTHHLVLALRPDQNDTRRGKKHCRQDHSHGQGNPYVQAALGVQQSQNPHGCKKERQKQPRLQKITALPEPRKYPDAPPPTFNKNWHDHKQEIATGRVQVHDLPPDKAKEVADLVARTDGIIFHLWSPDDRVPSGRVMIAQSVGHVSLTEAELKKGAQETAAAKSSGK